VKKFFAIFFSFSNGLTPRATSRSFSLKPGKNCRKPGKTGQKTGHLEKRFIQQKSLKI
jgi:hypothetical protein